MRPLWLLEELGEPYELRYVRLSLQEQRQPVFLSINPFGFVPTLHEEENVIFESGAICIYLADKFSGKELSPPLMDSKRGAFLQWCFFATSTLEPPVLAYFESGRASLAAKETFCRIGHALEEELSDSAFILGSKFSAADVLLGSILNWAASMELTAGFPHLEGYTKRLKDRPAFQCMLRKNEAVAP